MFPYVGLFWMILCLIVAVKTSVLAAIGLFFIVPITISVIIVAVVLKDAMTDG